MARDDPPAAPRVTHFDRREANAIEVGEDLYLYLDPDDPALIPARCPHRGGPLHLAAVERRPQGGVLICPWHGTQVPLRALKRRAAATVQAGDRVCAVIDAPDGVELVVRSIPLHIVTDDACAGGCARAHRKDASRP